MNCTLCNREAKERSVGAATWSEAFCTLSWEKVDITEFKAREQDGRTVWISEVCPECMTKHNNGRPPLGVKDINKMRERGITEEQYYKEHGY